MVVGLRLASLATCQQGPEESTRPSSAGAGLRSTHGTGYRRSYFAEVPSCSGLAPTNQDPAAWAAPGLAAGAVTKTPKTDI